MDFPVVRYGCKSWTIKKAEHLRIDVFELWCWRRLLRVPWTAGKSNQSILKEINPEYSLEGTMLKLKLQYSGHLIQRTDPLEKTLMLGKIEGRRMASLTQWTWIWANFRSWWWTGKPGVMQSTGLQRVGHEWTELRILLKVAFLNFKVKSLISNIIIIKDQSKRVGIDWEIESDMYTLLYLK